MRTQVQVRILELLHLAHPSAKADFFDSDHCPINSEVIHRSYELLKADGYYDEKQKERESAAQRSSTAPGSVSAQ